jgi:hypothetical protein
VEEDGTRLAEDHLVAHLRRRLPGHGGLGRPDWDNKQLKRTKLLVVQTVDGLRQNRPERAVKQERERDAEGATGTSRMLGNFDKLNLEWNGRVASRRPR